MSCAGQHPINNLENICCEIVRNAYSQPLTEIVREDAAAFQRLHFGNKMLIPAVYRLG